MSVSIPSLLQKVRNDSTLAPDIVEWRVFPGQDPELVSPRETLGRKGLFWMDRLGAERLYSHQARALDMVRSGENTVVGTPTASGKSLIYTLPLLRQAAEEGKRSLLLFPLKALARDQLQGLLRTVEGTVLDKPGSIAVYDGDTSSAERARIRRDPPRILLTNPDMLHYALLPYHHLWSEFFRDLRLMVVDEVHTYRGVMGTNMAWVFRRLNRICAYYGAGLQYIFCSATIANPEELSSRLTGQRVSGVSRSGSGRAKRHYVLLNPAKGPTPAVLALLEQAVRLNLRTIVYTQSRKMTELIAMWIGERDADFKKRIQAYRAGLLPSDRREIEAKLANGELLAVVSTSALELGIDIGDLDVCILAGYPGSVMATLQRAGRVGRQSKESAVFLVSHEDAMDQYLMRNPDALFSSQPESAVINPENREIAGRHLYCAAADLPLGEEEEIMDFSGGREIVSELVQRGKLQADWRGELYYSRSKYPHREVDLRGSGSSYSIHDRFQGRTIGSVDGVRAFQETHPGAVYLHMGRTYLVEELDTEKKTVLVRPFKANYFTRVLTDKNTRIIEVLREKDLGSARLGWGRLRVTEKVVGYEKRLTRGQSLIGRVELDLPEQVFTTQGMWLVLPESLRREAEEKKMHFMGGIHAVEHVLIGVTPFFVLTDRNDLGGISIPYHEQIDAPGVFVYDGVSGGVGLTRQAFELAGEVAKRALKVVRDCDCDNGCPACVYSPKCGAGNRPLDKEAAAVILDGVLHGERRERESVCVVPEENVEPSASWENGEKRYAVLDIETRRSAQEVGGWHKAGDMGVSCAVVYDSFLNDYFPFYQNELEGMAEMLARADVVVGFNLFKFDYRVLSGVLEYPWQELPTLDILLEVHSILGFRLSLDKLAGETLGTVKSANGLMALKWWKEGRIEKIVNYCRQDVAVTRDLYLFGGENGYLLYTNKAGKSVRVPTSWGVGKARPASLENTGGK